jgi:DnaJ-class molecular chaperone
MAINNNCPSCNGKGKTWLSCCGDDMYVGERSDYQICPSCGEHTDDETDDAEICEDCNGTGIIQPSTN